LFSKKRSGGRTFGGRGLHKFRLSFLNVAQRPISVGRNNQDGEKVEKKKEGDKRNRVRWGGEGRREKGGKWKREEAKGGGDSDGKEEGGRREGGGKDASGRQIRPNKVLLSRTAIQWRMPFLEEEIGGEFRECRGLIILSQKILGGRGPEE